MTARTVEAADAQFYIRNLAKCTVSPAAARRRPVVQGLSLSWADDFQESIQNKAEGFETSSPIQSPNRQAKEKLLLEDALLNGNVTYAKFICGILGALAEFCIRGNSDAVHRIFSNHADLARSADSVLPPVGTLLNGTKRIISEQDFEAASKTLFKVKREMQIRDAFETGDLEQLEHLFSGNLRTGVLEACRRNNYRVAKHLGVKLYHHTPHYRQLNTLFGLEEETPQVQEMMQKLHVDVCQQCNYDDATRGPTTTAALSARSRSCLIM